MCWVLGSLQQTGEGAVHNVAHTVNKGLKYKIRNSQIALYNLIANFTLFVPYFRPSPSTGDWDILQLFYTHVNIQIIAHSLQVSFQLNSRYPPNCAVSKSNCAIIYYYIYCYSNYQYCCLQLHIVMCKYTSTLHHYVTLHYKHDTV